jgi:hypothetical protein
MSCRRAAIFAAVEAHNRTHPGAKLRRPAALLLAVMFADADTCCVSQQTLRAEGFGNNVARVLRALVEAGLLSRQQSVAAPDRHKPGSGPYTYRLHLPADADVGA